jgi:predicted esterase
MIATLVTLPLLAPLAPALVQDETPPPAVLTVGEDEHKRYVLHAPPAETKAPKDGWRLLVVMPGGSGNADFAAFVGRIRENVFDDRWLVVQLVAPVWDAEQAEKLVWPTKKSPWPKMAFPCEQLFADVLAEVEKTRELDPRYLFTLAWSSSGTLAYTLALEPKTRVTGTFVAMSVFKPDALPSLKTAKGRAFHILHSADDFIPIAMAEQARDELEERKAVVSYATYEGGHGWHGDVYGNLRAGFAALERAAQKAKR